MKIYFTADNQAEEKLQKRFSQIVDILSNAGVLVMSNLAQRNISGFSSQDLEKIERTGEVLLERVDALVIEGTRNIPESGYLVALALTHKKPILYLLENGKAFNKNLLYLGKDQSTAKLLQLESYSDADLEKIILDFLQLVEKGEERQVPSIKFTLRITPRIERYLRWKTHNTKISKADYLRGMVEGMIDNDEGYKKFISDNR